MFVICLNQPLEPHHEDLLAVGLVSASFGKGETWSVQWSALGTWTLGMCETS